VIELRRFSWQKEQAPVAVILLLKAGEEGFEKKVRFVAESWRWRWTLPLWGEAWGGWHWR
jgi:hypothetical protein